MNENLINLTLTSAELKEVTDALEIVTEKLNAVLSKSITKETLDTMQKLGDRSIFFTQRAIEIASQEPSLVPSYLDVNQAKTDLALFLQLQDLDTKMQYLANLLQNNKSLAGAEALDFANDFYNTIRFLKNNNHPVAKQAFEELSDRYQKQKRKKSKTQE
jgi:hypothetical protein